MGWERPIAWPVRIRQVSCCVWLRWFVEKGRRDWWMGNARARVNNNNGQARLGGAGGKERLSRKAAVECSSSSRKPWTENEGRWSAHSRRLRSN